MIYSAPGTEGSKVEVLAEYGNFIGGEFRAPIDGEYADNPTPVNRCLELTTDEVAIFGKHFDLRALRTRS